MSGPGVVCIKRKRSEQAPETLIVEPSSKRNRLHIHYILRKDDDSNNAKSPSAADESVNASMQREAAADANLQAPTHRSPGPGSSMYSSPCRERRTFHLKHPDTPDSIAKKRKKSEPSIATFIEKRARKHSLERPARQALNRSAAESAVGPAPASAEHFKRPGKLAANPRASQMPQLGLPTRELDAMADSLHQFALEEAAREAKPQLTILPRLSGARSRELHHQRTAGGPRSEAGVDADMEDETEYVYDTYVLAPAGMSGGGFGDGGNGGGSLGSDGGGASGVALGSVGYLIITDEDQAAWETYIEDEPSDKDWDSDDDDENAEDWYGADYPDEELMSDDEFDRNAYAYRTNGASDDEEWDVAEQGWTDDEAEDRTLQHPRARMAQQLRRYIGGARHTGEA